MPCAHSREVGKIVSTAEETIPEAKHVQTVSYCTSFKDTHTFSAALPVMALLTCSKGCPRHADKPVDEKSSRIPHPLLVGAIWYMGVNSFGLQALGCCEKKLLTRTRSSFSER